MKRTLIIAATALAAAFSLSSQSFTVYTKDGEAIGYNNDKVDRIEFSPTSIPESPHETEVLDFNACFTSINPAEGIIDTTAAPLGLGKITINLKGTFMQNVEESHEITLTGSDGEIFRRTPTDEGMNIFRDIMGGTTELVFTFTTDGYLVSGNYHLTIPEGAYVTTNGDVLGGKVFIFVIETPAPEQTYVADPAQGILETLSELTFKYDHYSIVEPYPTAKAYATRDGYTYPEAMAVPTVADDGTVTISFSPAISAPGIYSITIPEGAFGLRQEEGGKVYSSKAIKLVYEIEGAPQLPPKVGDFYYSDGSWSTSLVTREGVEPVGVIFYIGEASEYGDNASYYKTKDGSANLPEFHGYVVALRDATYFDGVHHSVPFSFYNSWDDGCGCSVSDTDFLGYNNTASIKARADRDFGGLSPDESNFPAAYYAAEYFDTQVAAPAQSSGWFLPSAGQLKYIYDHVYFPANGAADDAACVQNSLARLESVGGMPMYTRDSEYWSSTEIYDPYGCSYRANYVCFDESMFTPGFVTWSNKNGEFRIRAVLAF